ncbi:MAG: hypothetical protein VX730_09030 [Pseudomonadota bacterium]|nr:hypothetical protein [Pseudomonadota bacterium]
MAFKLAKNSVQISQACADELKEHPMFAPCADQLKEGLLFLPTLDCVYDKAMHEILSKHSAEGDIGIYRQFLADVPTIIVGVRFDGKGNVIMLKGSVSQDGYEWEEETES